MRHIVRLAAVTGAIALAAAVSSPRDALAQDAGGARAAAKSVSTSYRDAVVHLKISMKVTMSFGGEQGPSNDQMTEALGTVIDPSGLTVLSENALGGGGMMEAMGGMFGGDEGGISVSSEVGEVKMLMKDGKEVPARIVLRDKDLDLAFAVPTEKGLTFTHVPLDGAKDPEVLDTVIALGRLGANLDRTPTVALGTVNAVVRKPRTFFVCDVGAGAILAAGGPVFDGSGKLVGIFLQRRGASGGGGGGIADIVSSMLPVVLPAADVKEGAQQALAEAAKTQAATPTEEGVPAEKEPAPTTPPAPEPPKEPEEPK